MEHFNLYIYLLISNIARITEKTRKINYQFAFQQNYNETQQNSSCHKVGIEMTYLFHILLLLLFLYTNLLKYFAGNYFEQVCSRGGVSSVY